MLIKFWGVHGSLPRPGPSTLRFGGNTACVEVRCGDHLIIFDAGSGIRELGEDLCRQRQNSGNSSDPLVGHIFFSHLHWDHVQGFPFFGPVFQPGNEFHLYGGRDLSTTLHCIMDVQMCHPRFPVTLGELGAAITFHDLVAGERVHLGDVVVTAERLNHPGGSFGYRLEYRTKSLIYATDTEHVSGETSEVVELARGGDVLIYDSMFTPEQYLGLWDCVSRESWGHSTWEHAVEVAQLADVKRLILFHHGNDDTWVEEIEKRAKERFPSAIAAYEGLEIEL